MKRPTKIGVLLASLLGVLAYRGVLSAGELARELGAPGNRQWREALTLPEEARIRRALEARDRAAELPHGYHHALYRALAEHVPLDGRVFILADREQRAAPVTSRLQILLFPRFLRRDDPGPLPASFAGDRRTFVVDFEERSAPILERAFERVASQADWTLWRWREGPR